MKIALILLATMSLTAGDSKPIPKKDVPAQVMEAFKRAYPSATLKAISSEKRDGKICYELESLDGKQKRDLIYAADGSVMEIEESIPLSALPEPVKKAMADQHPKAVLKSAEKLIRGTNITFEVIAAEGKKSGEFLFDSNGHPKTK